MAKILTPQERLAIVEGAGASLVAPTPRVLRALILTLAASHEALEKEVEWRRQMYDLGVMAKHADPTRLAYLAIFKRDDAYHASITTLKGILLDVMSNVDWCEIVELLADNENEYGLPSTWDEAPTN